MISESYRQSDEYCETFGNNVESFLRDGVERIWAYPGTEIPS